MWIPLEGLALSFSSPEYHVNKDLLDEGFVVEATAPARTKLLKLAGKRKYGRQMSCSSFESNS